MQPLNRSFCCCPQKSRKALRGRRCRPLWTAEGKQRNPSAFTCLFSYRLPISAKECENRLKQVFAFAGLVFTRREAASRHTGRHRGAQGGVLHLRHEWGLVDFFAVQIIGEDFRFFLCCELP